MSNYFSEWRICVMGYLQLIASIKAICIMVGALMTVLHSDSSYPRQDRLVIYTALIILALSGHLLSSIQLIKATGSGREINDAFKRCLFWQIITGVCNILMDIAVFGVWYMFETSGLSTVEIDLMVMVIAILFVFGQIFCHYAVYRFMLDLDNNCDHHPAIAYKA